MPFTVTTPKGWVGQTYPTTDPDDAEYLAEKDGYEVLEVREDMVIVADEEPTMPDDEVDQLDYAWNQGSGYGS